MIDTDENPEEQVAIAAAKDGELRLQDPAVRASAVGVWLFDPEFVEVGASGRSWTYDEMVAALPTPHHGTESP